MIEHLYNEAIVQNNVFLGIVAWSKTQQNAHVADVLWFAREGTFSSPNRTKDIEILNDRIMDFEPLTVKNRLYACIKEKIGDNFEMKTIKKPFHDEELRRMSKDILKHLDETEGD